MIHNEYNLGIPELLFNNKKMVSNHANNKDVVSVRLLRPLHRQ